MEKHPTLDFRSIEVRQEGDFGITWNQALEAGGWLVGKQVRIEVSAQPVER